MAIGLRAFLPLVAVFFIGLVATFGFASKALAQISPPAISNVNPNSGPAAGGTGVTITGSNFSGAFAVTFGSTPAASFSVISPGQINATSPAGTGTVDIRVTTSGGPSPITPADQFTYTLVTPTVTLSSVPNPSNVGQTVTFTVTVTGVAPTGTVLLQDGTTTIGTSPLTAGTATFTTSSLAAGNHSMEAKYSGDANNAAATSPVLIQVVNGPGDSVKLRQMQTFVMPVAAQISGQATIGAIENAIDAGFSDNPQAVTPNGSGFTFQIGAGEPAPARTGAPRTGSDGGAQRGPGSLASGRSGGNGAPAGTRLIDMSSIPLPPGSGMPPAGETQFAPDEVVLQFGPGVSPQQVNEIAQRFGLTVLGQQTIGMLGRSVYTFRIANGQTVRSTIRQVEGAGLSLAIQPHYAYRTTQNDPQAAQIKSLQYVVDKLHLNHVHRSSKGDGVVIAVIDSEIDINQPNLAGTITDRYNAGCGAASSPHAHGTGMAGAIASHGDLLGVAPNAKIIAICAFDGSGQAQSSTMRVINGLDYAIRRGAKIVNMSFAGPQDPALAQALQIARERGVLVVAAAGNAGPKSPPLYPGADPNVLAVTATDENDGLFDGANRGKYVTIAAPGVNVLVPAPGGGVQLTTGTSVATANVSGVAALLMAQKPSLKPEEIRALMVSSARHLGGRGFNSQFGHGLIDPRKALELIVATAPDNDGVRRFVSAPDAGRNTVDEGFAALGYAGEGSVTKARPAVGPSRDWLAWIDIRGTNFSRNTVGSDLKGTQINATVGLTRKLTPDFLVGVFTGYEHFGYNSQAFNGVLKGDGWTAGAYLGWRLSGNLRFDIAGARSNVLINNTAGLSSASYTGQRWLATGGFTGNLRMHGVVLEPSARVSMLWEHENAYSDNFGTQQADRNFAVGRASGGAKVIYPTAWSGTTKLAPYVGLYGDYYFSRDDASNAGLASTPMLQGWSARATAGLGLSLAGGAQLTVGGEFGGIGSDTHIWTWRARGSLPF